MFDKFFSQKKHSSQDNGEYSSENTFKKYYNGNISLNYNEKSRLVLKKGDNINYTYEILDKLGGGAFSDVYKCKDHKNNSKIALKVIRNEERFNECAEYEYNLLKKINEYEEKCVNIINLKKFFTFNNNLFLIFDIHGLSLYKYYSDYNNIINIKDFSTQILLGLVHLHKLNIVHADLKPENILIKDNILKIIDLGSSFEEKEHYYNTYIQSRWYRSPEVLFNYKITRKIDVWSYGCIIYELYYKEPLFAGKNTNRMKNLIVQFTNLKMNSHRVLIPTDLKLNKILLSCLEFKYINRISTFELIKDEYFKPSKNI